MVAGRAVRLCAVDARARFHLTVLRRDVSANGHAGLEDYRPSTAVVTAVLFATFVIFADMPFPKGMLGLS